MAGLFLTLGLGINAECKKQGQQGLVKALHRTVESVGRIRPSPQC